jgi:uncharacterized metal-binding protein
MNGTAHRLVTVLLILPIGYTVFYLNPERLDLAIVSSLGCALGILIQPDLDMAETPKNPLHYPFFLYGRLIRHRSFFSHFPIVGSTGRVLYITFLLWPIWLLLGHPPINVNMDFLKWAFVGLCAADGAHFICDGFGIEHRKK